MRTTEPPSPEVPAYTNRSGDIDPVLKSNVVDSLPHSVNLKGDGLRPDEGMI